MTVIEEINEYKKLFDDGIIDGDEFANMKASSINNIMNDGNDVSVLRDVKALLDAGILTEEEFNVAKNNVLNTQKKRNKTFNVPSDIQEKIKTKDIKKNKKMIIGIVGVVIVFMLIIKLVAGGGTNTIPFGFKLGESFDDAMKKAKSIDTNAEAIYGNTYIKLKTTMFDYEWDTELSFIEGNCVESLKINTCKTVTKDEYEAVVKKLTSKYGKPSRSGKNANNGWDISIWECNGFDFYSTLEGNGTIRCFFAEPGEIIAEVI